MLRWDTGRRRLAVTSIQNGQGDGWTPAGDARHTVARPARGTGSNRPPHGLGIPDEAVDELRYERRRGDPGVLAVWPPMRLAQPRTRINLRQAGSATRALSGPYWWSRRARAFCEAAGGDIGDTYNLLTKAASPMVDGVPARLRGAAGQRHPPTRRSTTTGALRS